MDERLWVYDLRVNQHFTLEQNPLRRSHLDEFVESYRPRPASHGARRERAVPLVHLRRAGRATRPTSTSPGSRDASLENLDNLPAPEVIAREIVDDLAAALAEFEAVAAAVEATSTTDAA